MSESERIQTMSESAFGWYFTGISDGEACFHVQRYLSKTKQGPIPRFNARFRIVLRGDDAPALESIARRIGCGRTYRSDYSRRTSTIRGNPQIEWVVIRASELAEKIVPHFEAFPLQTKKARDFGVWKQIVSLLCSKGRTYRPGEIEALQGLMDRLRCGRQYRKIG